MRIIVCLVFISLSRSLSKYVSRCNLCKVTVSTVALVSALLSGSATSLAQSWSQQPLYQYPNQVFIEYYLSDYGQTLVQTSDGNLDGTEDVTGTWFRATPGGFNFDILLSYASSGQQYGLTSRMLAASDGNLYGPYGGEVYQVTPAGAVNFLDTSSLPADFNAQGSLIETNDGTLYGLGNYGPDSPTGIIYKLVLPNTFSVFYTFPNTSGYPFPSWLTLGADGNLYGTTSYGTGGGSGAYGLGSIFEITPAGTYTTLYSFTGGADGSDPESLIQGSDGNFYGVSGTGVFQYQPTGALISLHTFGSASNGYHQIPDLLEGSDGNLYGATSFKSKTQPGFVYQLSTAGTFTVVANDFSDIEYPTTGLLQATDGNFYLSYGATNYAPQTYGMGGIVQVDPPSKMAAPVALSSSASTVVAGSPVTLTWSVSNLASGSNSPCFASGGWSGWKAVSGTAVVTPAMAGPAIYGLTCGGFESNSVTVNVTNLSQQATTTALTVSPQSIVRGQTTTLTATVTPSGTTAPTGTVNFFVGTQKAGSATLNGAGVAVLNASQVNLPVGNYSIYADYLGDANNSPSKSTAVSAAIRSATATTMTASTNPVPQGQAVTLTANITNATGTYGGTMTFYYGNSVIASVPMAAAGSATLYVPQANVPVGTYSVTAHYSGDSTHAASISPAVQVTVKASPKVVLAIAPNPVTKGQNVTITVKVTATESGDPTASGTVALVSSGTTIANLSLNGSGQASLTVSSGSYSAGTYPVQALYAGDGNYLAGRSNVIEEKITP